VVVEAIFAQTPILSSDFVANFRSSPVLARGAILETGYSMAESTSAFDLCVQCDTRMRPRLALFT